MRRHKDRTAGRTARLDACLVPVWPTLHDRRICLALLVPLVAAWCLVAIVSHPAFAGEKVEELNRLGLQYDELLQQGKHPEAIAVQERVVELSAQLRGPDSVEHASSLQSLGRLYQEMHQYEKAEPLLVQALAIRKKVLGEEHPDYAISLEDLGGLYWDTGRYEEVEPLWAQALEVLNKTLGQDHPAYAGSLSNLAGLYQKTRQYEKAEPLLVRQLGIRRKVLGEQHPDYVASLNSLGRLYWDMGRYEKGEMLLGQALEIQKKTLGQEHPDYAASLDTLGVLYYQAAQYEKAETLLVQALEILSKVLGRESAEYGNSLSHLAMCYDATAQYEKEEPLLLQALEVKRKALGQDDLLYAASLTNLAVWYYQMGQYEKEEPLLLQALETRKKVLGEEHPGYAFSLHSLASLYWDMGQYEKAEPLLVQALAIRKKVLGEEHPHYADNLAGLAGLYQDMGRYEKAEPLYKQALAIRRKVQGEDHPETATSLDNLAGLYDATGQYEKAEPLYEQALAIERKVLGEEHPDYARSLNNLAVLYRDMGRYEKAEPLLAQALAIKRKVLGEDHPDYATSLRNLGLLCCARQDPAEGIRMLDQAMVVRQHLLGRVFGVSSERAMRGFLSTVSSDLDTMVSMAALQAGNDSSAAETALTWALRRKGVVLETLCRLREAERLMQQDPSVADQAAQYRGLRQRLNDLALNPPPGMEAAALQMETARLRQEADRLESDLNRALSQQQREQPEADVDSGAVRRRLPPGSALVEFVRVGVHDFQATGTASIWKPPHYFAFVVSTADEKPVQMIDLGEAEAIEEAVRELRASVDQTRRVFERLGAEGFGEAERALEEEFRSLSVQLERRVFAPLKPALGTATLLYLALDGELNRVPFESLVDEEGKYLIEGYRFAYLSSGSDLLESAPPPASGTVVFAGPDYEVVASRREEAAKTVLAALPEARGETVRGATAAEVRGLRWGPLVGAEGEAKDIAGELAGSAYAPVTSYVRGEALEEVLKALPAPRVLHFSTHGFFLPDQQSPSKERSAPAELGTGSGTSAGLARLQAADNPLLRSGIVLSGANALGEEGGQGVAAEDGWVTAEEIAMMDLRGTELVVLSACESGLGEVKCGEGVYGLRRAFQYAGARSLLTSLFKVPDAQTREMMRAFYRGLRSGQGKLEALRQAQLATIRQRRAQHGAAHPFFWASFVLVGDPS